MTGWNSDRESPLKNRPMEYAKPMGFVGFVVLLAVRGTYGYNFARTARDDARARMTMEGEFLTPTLGLGAWKFVTKGVPESSVVAPDDMIAIGDTAWNYGWGILNGFGWPGRAGASHSGERNNAAFCDGHVECSKPRGPADEYGRFQADGDRDETLEQ
jgi:prepilin-type processing-associated H-X9-DG protein